MTLAANGITGAAGAAAPADRAERDRKALATAAREFEALFLLQMLKQMRQSMLSEEEEEPGLGSATMVDTIDSELARQLAGSSGLSRGLTDSFSGASRVRPAAGDGALTATPAGIPTLSGTAPSALVTLGGAITSDFGWRQDPIDGASRFHKGVDIRAAYGREVPAAAGGVVISAGTAGGYGESVVIDHGNGLKTRYAHLSVIGVATGDSVSAGQVVGRVGQSGRATGPHLHFEVLQNGKPLDPAQAALKLAGGIADYPRGQAPAGSLAPGDHHED